MIVCYNKSTRRNIMKNIVIVHGIGGIEREPYFPHLKETCEKLGLKVFMPSLGSYSEGISYNGWKEYFDNNILPYIDQNTIIVAQSIGTQFAIKYILERNLNVGAYISCAGPRHVSSLRKTAPERALSFGPISSLFKPTDDEFEKFKQKGFPKYSLFCDNDIFFEQSNLEDYSKAINSMPIFIKGKGHFNFDAGVFELNELEDLIKEIVRKERLNMDEYYIQKAKYAYSLFLEGKSFKKVYAAVEKDGEFIVLEHENGKYKYSLSGGGVDEGEDNLTAIKRELKEELNVNVEIVRSLGVIKYFKTWHFEGKDFDVDYEAEIFLTKFLSYDMNEQFGLDGEFTDKKIKIAQISKDEMLGHVAEFCKFGLKL